MHKLFHQILPSINTDLSFHNNNYNSDGNNDNTNDENNIKTKDNKNYENHMIIILIVENIKLKNGKKKNIIYKMARNSNNHAANVDVNLIY